MSSGFGFATFSHDDDEDEQIISSKTETIPVNGPYVYSVKVTVMGDCDHDPCEKCDASKIKRFKVRNNRLISDEKLDPTMFSGKPTYMMDPLTKGFKQFTTVLEDLVGASDEPSDGEETDLIYINDPDLLVTVPTPPPPPAAVEKKPSKRSSWRQPVDPLLDRSTRDIINRVEKTPVIGTLAQAVEGLLDPSIDGPAPTINKSRSRPSYNPQSGDLDPVSMQALDEAIENALKNGPMDPSDEIMNSYMVPPLPSLDYPPLSEEDLGEFRKMNAEVRMPVSDPYSFSIDNLDEMVAELEQTRLEPVVSPIAASTPLAKAAAALASSKGGKYCGHCNHQCRVKVRTDVSVSKKKCCGC